MRLKNANSASFSKILRDMKRVDAAGAAFAGRDAGAPSVADSYVEFTFSCSGACSRPVTAFPMISGLTRRRADAGIYWFVFDGVKFSEQTSLFIDEIFSRKYLRVFAPSRLRVEIETAAIEACKKFRAPPEDARRQDPSSVKI
ncbi:MAG: hypothetical protein JSS81_19045 [Acidobacteria bacterium]|nr:hypothetical protein [Acidobacteriota bacterium]